MNTLAFVALWLAMQQAPECKIPSKYGCVSNVLVKSPEPECGPQYYENCADSGSPKVWHFRGANINGDTSDWAEPMDVPAVQHHCIHTNHLTAWCRVDATGYHDRHPDGWLCEDWDRILLTDEGGEHHCIKFPKSDDMPEGHFTQK